MIQAAQVASKFTLFTHHAKTFPLLVQALRNSLLKLGMFNDEKIAEEQVIGVLNFDIHLVKDFRGRRYIERVTECIPIEDKNEYTFEHRQEKTLEGKLDKFMDNATRFFSKTTNKELYKYVNILEYHDGTYVLTNPISDTTIMASAGAQCNHMNHVSTQLPYVVVVAAVSFITYIIAGFIHNPVVPLIIGIVLMTLTIILIKYIVNQKQSNS